MAEEDGLYKLAGEWRGELRGKTLRAASLRTSTSLRAYAFKSAHGPVSPAPWGSTQTA